ncbi:Angio-associated migratory cell protein [Aphelenchoides fujianensis]|nr:Angio-associated migratory cell protein [Aphelenchoides fujianensis]
MVPITDDSAHVLAGHSKDVFTLGFSPVHRLLLSGGEDDAAVLWDLDGIQTFDDVKKTVIQKHEDSVTQVNFNHDHSLFATADMSGRIFIHETTSRTALFEINECSDLEWTTWHFSCNVLFAGASDGSVFMFLLSKTQVERSKVFLTNTNAACTVGRLLPDGKHLLCGYDDGRVCLWELKDGSHRDVDLQSPCRSVDAHPKLSLAIVGTDGGQAALINTSSMSVIGRLGNQSKEKTDGELSVETVKFAPEGFPWVAVGTANGLLVIYDFETGQPRHECTHDEMAVVKSEWLLLGPREAAHPDRFKSGGGHEIFDFVVANLADQRLVFTACAEGAIRVFPYVEEAQKAGEGDEE